VDRTHVAQIGYQYLPDDKYVLTLPTMTVSNQSHRYKFAHLFSKEGDKIGYLYDFGDKWYHNIVVCQFEVMLIFSNAMILQVEKILSSEQSNGAIEIIDGKGMCPGGEDRSMSPKMNVDQNHM